MTKQVLINELLFLMTSVLDTDPVGPVLDIHASMDRALEIVTALEFLPGPVDLGESDPRAEAERTIYEEMNIFTLDREKDERIPVDRIHEISKNLVFRIPKNQRKEYMVSAVIDRLDASLKRNHMKDLGEHFETSMAELVGENQTRRAKILMLSNRYATLGEEYPAVDLGTRAGCFLKWTRDSMKEILALMILGEVLVVAAISWYRGCIERYTVTKDAGVYDLSAWADCFEM